MRDTVEGTARAGPRHRKRLPIFPALPTYRAAGVTARHARVGPAGGGVPAGPSPAGRQEQLTPTQSGGVAFPRARLPPASTVPATASMPWPPLRLARLRDSALPAASPGVSSITRTPLETLRSATFRRTTLFRATASTMPPPSAPRLPRARFETTRLPSAPSTRIPLSP